MVSFDAGGARYEIYTGTTAVDTPIQERPVTRRNMRSESSSALICRRKHITFSVAGDAELSALKSLLLVTRVLLNRVPSVVVVASFDRNELSNSST